MLKRLKKAFANPKDAVAYLMSQSRLMRFVGDERYIKWFWALQMNYPLDLENPRTFNEKLQWLKLHNRQKLFNTFVDKYRVRRYIADSIGEQYLIPLLGCYDSFDQIDFESLPEQFVLKCTHGSHCSVICRDKAAFDKAGARRKFYKWMRYNWYWYAREWPYKDVEPRIIAEAYMCDDSPENRGGLSDYKFSCFNGRADNVMVCIDRDKDDPKFYFFDKAWNLLRLNIQGKNARADFSLHKPARIDEMFEIAERLSEGIPYVRVDLYYVNDRIYFGELTLFPAGGIDPNLLPETDELFGLMIDLNQRQ